MRSGSSARGSLCYFCNISSPTTLLFANKGVLGTVKALPLDALYSLSATMVDPKDVKIYHMLASKQQAQAGNGCGFPSHAPSSDGVALAGVVVDFGAAGTAASLVLIVRCPCPRRGDGGSAG
jgi:hypothetical protein